MNVELMIFLDLISGYKTLLAFLLWLKYKMLRLKMLVSLHLYVYKNL
jgi:hypothetical protein